MITPDSFLKNWDNEYSELVSFEKDTIDSYALSEATKEFLIKVGLPKSCSPFLSFRSYTKGGGKRITEIKDFAIPYASYSKYIYLGFTGNGNSICINEENENIVYIDYDRNGREYFINSSLIQFIESVLAYMEFVERVRAEKGDKAFREGNMSKEALDWITQELKEIDPVAIKIDNFWGENLSYIEDDIEDCKPTGDVNAAGWSRNHKEYFSKLLEKAPEFFSKGNAALIDDGFPPIVDKTFASHLHQFRDYIGMELKYYHIGGGGQALPIPEALHCVFGEVHNAEKQVGIWGNDR